MKVFIAHVYRDTFWWRLNRSMASSPYDVRYLVKADNAGEASQKITKFLRKKWRVRRIIQVAQDIYLI